MLPIETVEDSFGPLIASLNLCPLNIAGGITGAGMRVEPAGQLGVGKNERIRLIVEFESGKLFTPKNCVQRFPNLPKTSSNLSE